MAPFKAFAEHAPVVITSDFLAAAAADRTIFTADRSYEVMEVIEAHIAAGAASSTMDIKKSASGTAPASGTSVLASTFALDSTVNVPVFKHAANGGLAAQATRTINRGDSLSIDMTGTVSAYSGSVTIVLRPIVRGSSY